MKLLMVCLGNICRSPLAEGILTEKFKKAGLNIIVDSAGTLSYHVGECPDSRSLKIAEKFGIDISKQKARKFSAKDFEDFDLIFAMDDSVYEELLSIAENENQKNKVHRFLTYAEHKTLTEVPDPYYGSISEFENVFRLLDDAGDEIVKKIIGSQGKNR